MKKLLLGSALFLVSMAAHAEGDYKPFFMFDVNSEKDEKHSQTTGDTVSNIARDYIGANLTVGVKGPNKMEYSIKTGASQKDKDGVQTVSNNIELKIKKSYQLTDSITPYAAIRLGEKIRNNGNNFAHYSIEGGVKFQLMDNLAFDTGLRYRNALSNDNFQKAFERSPTYDTTGTVTKAYTYESIRLHGMLLFDLDKANTIGLRYSQSKADDYEEERKSWRLHYQHNY
jgi:opacity protein-like surface antigen